MTNKLAKTETGCENACMYQNHLIAFYIIPMGAFARSRRLWLNFLWATTSPCTVNGWRSSYLQIIVNWSAKTNIIWYLKMLFDNRKKKYNLKINNISHEFWNEILLDVKNISHNVKRGIQKYLEILANIPKCQNIKFKIFLILFRYGRRYFTLAGVKFWYWRYYISILLEVFELTWCFIRIYVIATSRHLQDKIS